MNKATFGRFVRANQKTLGIFLLLVLITVGTAIAQAFMAESETCAAGLSPKMESSVWR